MRPADYLARRDSDGRHQPLPYPARPEALSGGEPAGQPHGPTGPASRARKSTTSSRAGEPPVLQERGPRAGAHVQDVNEAPDAARAVRESVHALVSVLTQAIRRDPESGAAWAWTAVHLVDGLNLLVENAVAPHPWFTRPASRRLNPAGWAPPPALAQVAARIAGDGTNRNGAQQ